MVAWNDSSNYNFGICVFQTNAIRIDRFWRFLIYVEDTLIQNVGSDFFGWDDGWGRSDIFGLEMWSESREPIGDTTDTEAIGPRWETVPGGYDFDVNCSDPYSTFDYSLIHTLIQQKRVPPGTTYSDIQAAIQAQWFTTIDEDTPVSPWSTSLFWKSAVLTYFESKRKLLWQSDPQINPRAAQIVYGRVPGLFSSGVDDGAYQPRVLWIDPQPDDSYKAWILGCGSGCCCCCC